MQLLHIEKTSNVSQCVTKLTMLLHFTFYTIKHTQSHKTGTQLIKR